MGREPLDELHSRAAHSGIFLDFDGTLSEIAPTPQAATAVPGSPAVLARLAVRFAVVAVVSGRRVSEVEDRLGHLAGVRLFGLYGIEDRETGLRASRSRAVEEVLPRVQEIAVGIRGCLVEPKGSNIAVHYRMADDPEAARVSLLRDLAPLAEGVGMRLLEGKRVVEMAPAAAPRKGDLVRREAAGLEAVLFAGDDVADLEAFAALDDLAAAGAVAVRVAVRTAETPSALIDAADISVEGPSGLLSLLEELAR